MKCKFKVEGRFDGAPSATVTIDRANMIVSVRPLRRKRTFDYPLDRLASYVIEKIVKAEVGEKLKARKRK